MAPLPVRIIFFAVAAAVIAYLVDRAANEIVETIELDRVVVERDARFTRVSYRGTMRPPHRAVRLLAIAVYTFGIVMFTTLTLGLAAEPQETSELNGIVYWAAFLFEIAVIGRAAVRVYRVMKNAV